MLTTSSASNENLKNLNNVQINGECTPLSVNKVKILIESAEEELLSSNITQTIESPSKVLNVKKEIEFKAFNFKEKEYKIRPSLLT